MDVTNYIFILFIFHSCRAFDALGCKELIMLKMTHENADVQYEALLAVQKLMVHNWYVLKSPNSFFYISPSLFIQFISRDSVVSYWPFL